MTGKNRTFPARVCWVALVAAVLSVVALSNAKAAGRKKKVAVLLVKTGTIPVELADSLTEWLIAQMAAKGKYHVVGKEAFKAQIGAEERQVFACINNPTCLTNVSTALGLDLILVGTLGLKETGKPGQMYVFNLFLIDATSAKEIKRVHRKVKGKQEKIGPSMETALTELLKPRIPPGGVMVKVNIAGAKVHLNDRFIGAAPVVKDKLKPGFVRIRVVQDGYYAFERKVKILPGRIVTVKVRLIKIPKKRRSAVWKAAWSTFGVGAGLGLAALIAGGIAGGKPKGETQVDVVNDWKMRKKAAVTANVLWGLTAALAITSTCLFIFGRKKYWVKAERPKADRTPVQNPRLGVVVTPGGAAAVGGFQW